MIRALGFDMFLNTREYLYDRRRNCLFQVGQDMLKLVQHDGCVMGFENQRWPQANRRISATADQDSGLPHSCDDLVPE